MQQGIEFLVTSACLSQSSVCPVSRGPWCGGPDQHAAQQYAPCKFCIAAVQAGTIPVGCAKAGKKSRGHHTVSPNVRNVAVRHRQLLSGVTPRVCGPVASSSNPHPLVCIASYFLSSFRPSSAGRCKKCRHRVQLYNHLLMLESLDTFFIV